MDALGRKKFESLGGHEPNSPWNPLLNSKSQSLVFGILTSLDIDPSLWLSPLLSLFLILKAELNSGPQNTA